MPDPRWLTRALVSADDDRGEVILRTVDLDVEDPREGPATLVRLTPERAYDLIRALTTSVEQAARYRAEAWRLGDCPTCGNRRMVEVMKPGRTLPTTVHCPDCRAEDKAADPEDYPRYRLASDAQEAAAHGA